VHGAENDFHSVVESRSLYARAGEPKELVELSDRGHTEWMRDDHPTFLRVVDLLDDFFARRLGVGVGPGGVRLPAQQRPRWRKATAD
jgi:hypothetical protein